MLSSLKGFYIHHAPLLLQISKTGLYIQHNLLHNYTRENFLKHWGEKLHMGAADGANLARYPLGLLTGSLKGTIHGISNVKEAVVEPPNKRASKIGEAVWHIPGFIGGGIAQDFSSDKIRNAVMPKYEEVSKAHKRGWSPESLQEDAKRRQRYAKEDADENERHLRELSQKSESDRESVKKRDAAAKKAEEQQKLEREMKLRNAVAFEHRKLKEEEAKAKEAAERHAKEAAERERKRQREANIERLTLTEFYEAMRSHGVTDDNLHTNSSGKKYFNSKYNKKTYVCEEQYKPKPYVHKSGNDKGQYAGKMTDAEAGQSKKASERYREATNGKTQKEIDRMHQRTEDVRARAIGIAENRNMASQRGITWQSSRERARTHGGGWGLR